MLRSREMMTSTVATAPADLGRVRPPGSPRTLRGGTGYPSFHTIAHNHEPMVKWMDEMLSQKALVVPGHGSSAGRGGGTGDRRAVFRARAALNAHPGAGHACEVTVDLLTGRTHQIRGQMAALGFPLVGDDQ